MMDIFDIYIAYVSWGEGGKTRPVLILKQHETVVFSFNITTQYKSKSESIRKGYFKITDWRQAGLAKQSYIDTNTVRDLPPAALYGRSAIGKLTEYDIQRLLEFLSR